MQQQHKHNMTADNRSQQCVLFNKLMEIWKCVQNSIRIIMQKNTDTGTEVQKKWYKTIFFVLI